MICLPQIDILTERMKEIEENQQRLRCLLPFQAVLKFTHWRTLTNPFTCEFSSSGQLRKSKGGEGLMRSRIFL